MFGDKVQLMPPILPLTSFRFFAAIVVVIYHCDNDHNILPFAIFHYGYEAVTFFFILSGFILTYSNNNTNYFREVGLCRRFYVARIARILPTYYVGLVLGTPFFLYSALVSAMVPIPSFVSGLITVPILVQAWFSPAASLWNTPAWSLSVEAFFYAIFPILLYLTPNNRPWIVLASTLLLVIFVASIRFVFFPITGEFGSFWFNFGAYFPLFHLPQFLFGMALCRAFTRMQFGNADPLFMIILISLGVASATPISIENVFKIPLCTVLFGAIIIGGAGSGLAARVFSARPLVFLGEASYTIYITHAPLLSWWHFVSKQTRFLSYANFGLYILTLLAFSSIILITIERPMKLWLLAQCRSKALAQ